MYTDDPYDRWDTVHMPPGGERDVGTVPPSRPEEADTDDAIRHALLDPFVDNLGIEYWIWNGSRLVPAWPDEVERIREREQAYEDQYQAELARQRAERRRRLLRPFTRLALVVVRVWASIVPEASRQTLHKRCPRHVRQPPVSALIRRVTASD